MFKEKIGFNFDSHIKTFINGVEDYPRHLHPDVMEIICVLEGSVSISDSSLSSRLTEGDVYIFNANDPHRISSMSDHNIILFLYLDIKFYNGAFTDLEKTYFICDSFSKSQQTEEELAYLKFLLAKILYHYESNRMNKMQIEENVKLLLTFLIENMRFYTYERDDYNHLRIKKRNAPLPENTQLTRIYSIIDYIYDHFREKLELKDIAEREYLNTYYLSHFIKQACGLTFKELLSLARCEEAEKLLGTTNMSIDEITSEVGFSSRKHLGIQFKKWYRTTPSGYRRNRRLEESQNRIETKFQSYNKIKAYEIIKMYLNQGNPDMQSLFENNTIRDHLKLLSASGRLYESLTSKLRESDSEDISELFEIDSLIPVGDYHSFVENYEHYLRKEMIGEV